MNPPATTKRVFRIEMWLDPVFEERLGREPGVVLVRCPVKASEDEFFQAVSTAHVYHTSSAKDEVPHHAFTTDALIGRCPELLIVSTYGAGYDTVDVAACTRAGIIVVNQAGGNAQSVAEHTLGFALAVSHRIGESDRLLRRARGFSREDLMGREIAGKVFGVVGIGHVGTSVARLARAFGMEVLAVDPYLTEEEIARRGARAVTFEALLAQSDFVSLHCPRDKSTLGMMNADAFAQMKPGSVFLTTARGGIHDEKALLAALRSGQLAGAGIDVWDREPPPLDHPLLACDNVVGTVHTAGVTREARRNVAAMGAEQIAGLLKGGRPPRLVNPEAWPAYVARFEALMGIAVAKANTDED
ncbi:MAG: hydroxyacid dehydrogenase [Burkholderiales bacterium]|nr:hydroxyacid dehydrogenase [Burkholderiales bacterium]